MKEKNQSAVALGKRSAEARKKKMGKKALSEYMREMQKKSVASRKKTLSTVFVEKPLASDSK